MPRGDASRLIPNSQRTSEEVKKITSKAGRASGAARRRKRTMQEVAKSLLDSKGKDIPDSIREKALELGIDVDDTKTVRDLILESQTKMSLHNTKAAEFIRDTSGEKPVEQVEIKPIKIEVKWE